LEQESLARLAGPGKGKRIVTDRGRFGIGGRRLQDEALRIAPRAAIAIGADTRLELLGASIRGTRTTRIGVFGHGLFVNADAMLQAAAVLIADSSEIGAFVGSQGATFTDLLVLGVTPSVRGFGAGLYARQGAQIDGERLAIQSVGAAGVVSLPFESATNTRVTVTDLFVREVQTSTIRFAEDQKTITPEPPYVAYGLYAGPACAIDATRAVLNGGRFGFFNASGQVYVRRGVIVNQSEGLGAITPDTAPDAMVLDRVTQQGNGSTVIVEGDAPMPSPLPSLPSPSPPPSP
jgi:hypothetical protein